MQRKGDIGVAVYWYIGLLGKYTTTLLNQYTKALTGLEESIK